MKRVNGKRKILAVALIIFAVMLLPLSAYAADAKILETSVYDDEIYIYIKGISGLSSDSVIQIGNAVCPSEQIASSMFEQMNLFMRTLILVDNSKSIPEKNHADIQELLKGIISNSKENEQIKIGTFSREAAYLCDYTNDHAILENVVNNITYNDQDTYLSDVLYNIISELIAENTFVCTRIIILSDGADDNAIGYSNDEVRRYIESNPYPVYTIGIPKKNNAPQLETMFSFSRAAKADYFLMDGSITNDEVVNALLTDQTGVCLKITPNENLKDGSNKSILLKLNTAEGDFELKTSADMPFGEGIASQPTIEPEPTTESEPESSLPIIGSALPTELDENNNHSENNDSQSYLWIFILLAVIIAVLLAVIIILALTKRKKTEPTPTLESEPQPEPAPNPANSDDIDTKYRRAPAPNPEPVKELWSDSQKYLSLRNLDIPNTFYKVPIKDAVCIGRRSTQDIVIDDVEASREHCRIILRGNLMYLESCNHGNGTYYENVLIHEGDEVPIVNGGKIKIGQYQYCVELQDN